MASESLKYTCWHNNPIGTIFLLAKNNRLCRIIIDRKSDECLSQLQAAYKQQITADETCFTKALKELDEYFQQKRRTFDLKLDISAGTDFQKRVWRILSKIPYGQVRSYQWVAQQAGVPKGARATGAANRANPLPIVIPCHRVIKADGSLGGYSGGGQVVKQTLLKLEGTDL